MVEEVEELCSKLDIHPFVNAGSLEDCEIEIVDALLPDGSVDPRFIAEIPGLICKPVDESMPLGAVKHAVLNHPVTFCTALPETDLSHPVM